MDFLALNCLKCGKPVIAAVDETGEAEVMCGGCGQALGVKIKDKD